MKALFGGKGPDKNDDEEESEGGFFDKLKKSIDSIKEYGVAGAVSFTLWGGFFRNIYLIASVYIYKEAAGHWPDYRSAEDWAKVSAEWFAIINILRPLEFVRVALAIKTAPWVDENIIQSEFVNGVKENIPYFRNKLEEPDEKRK